MMVRCGWLMLAGLAFPCMLAGWQAGPDALQAQGIARLDRFTAQVRSNGLQPSLLNDLNTAASELSLSYRGFVAASDFARAAWSLVRLADCERQSALVVRMTRGPHPEKLAASARDHYQEAAALARKTKMNFYLVKALTGLALIEQTEFHDFGAANSQVTEAIRAAAACPNPRDCMRDALAAKVDLETRRGELASALSHVNGLLSLLKGSSDLYQFYHAFSGRGSIYYALADGCSDSYDKSPPVCARLFTLSEADWKNAQDGARQAGFNYFATLAGEQIQQLGILRKMSEAYHSFPKMPAGMFNPKTPKDVLATEIPPLGQIPANILEQFKALADAKPSFPGALSIYIQASLDDNGGQTAAALEGYLRAIHMVEQDRQKLGEDAARTSFLDDKAGYYRRPILMLLRDHRDAEAFDLIESTQARVIADLLSTKSLGLSKPVDRRLFATLALKRANIASLQTGFVNDALSPERAEAEDPDAVAKQETQLAEQEQDYERLLLRIAGEAPEAQKIAISRPASLSALQNNLRQDPADVLYYYLTDTAVILIHIGADSFHVRNVFLPRFVLQEKVKGLVDSMRKQDVAFRDDLSKELFLFLIQPAVEWLRTDRLVIIPRGELDALPFQALRDLSGAFAGERFQITYAPSASVLLQLPKQRTLAGATLFAAADPSLPGAQREVTTLAALFPSHPKVSAAALIGKDEFVKSAGTYNILHLAVHGEFDGQEPLLSHVNLAAGEQGYLTAAEMFGLPLENTRLITLSACETGRVRTTRANDIQGIQQALLFAGAQSLLVSAWKVDSESTSLWMRAFYREAQTKTLAAAEREAVRQLCHDPKYGHPHHWAPFLLIAR